MVEQGPAIPVRLAGGPPHPKAKLVVVTCPDGFGYRAWHDPDRTERDANGRLREGWIDHLPRCEKFDASRQIARDRRARRHGRPPWKPTPESLPRVGGRALYVPSR